MRDKLDFMIIGQLKCGTTSLFRYLGTHPAVFIPVGKEEAFFCYEFPDTPYRTWTDYMSVVFNEAPSNAVLGKVTPQYMSGTLLARRPRIRDANPERLVPERIRAVMPDVRLIAILREPVARAVSEYRMEVSRMKEPRSFDAAIGQLLEPDALVEARRRPSETNGYVMRGEYGRILQGFYDVFPREQILVVFTEDLEREPQTVIKSVLAQIGVDSAFVPPNLGVHYYALGRRARVQWLTRRQQWHHLTQLPWLLEQRSARNRTLRAGWHLAPLSVRRQILTRYWAISQRIGFWHMNGRPRPRLAPPYSSETRHRLEEHYAEDRRHLSELLGRELPSWAHD